MASMPVSSAAPVAPGLRIATSGTHSVSYNSLTINEFVDETQQKFVDMLLSLAGYINIVASVLQLNIVMGAGHTFSSTITSDPVIQSVGLLPQAVPYVWACQLTGQRSSQFLIDLRTRFQVIVNRLATRAAVLVFDMRLGDHYHLNSFMRVSPQLASLPSPSNSEAGNDPPSPGNGGDGGADGDVPDGRAGCDVSLALLPVATSDNTSVMAPAAALDDDEVFFGPPPPGAVAAFFQRFNRAAIPDGTELALSTDGSIGGDADHDCEEDDDLELTSAYESDADS